jgi:hypothetical protein
MFSAGFKFIDIERLKCESFQDYLERCNFVVMNFKSEKYDLGYLIEKSKLFRAVKVLKCVYPENVMKEINEMSLFAGLKL